MNHSDFWYAGECQKNIPRYYIFWLDILRHAQVCLKWPRNGDFKVSKSFVHRRYLNESSQGVLLPISISQSGLKSRIFHVFKVIFVFIFSGFFMDVGWLSNSNLISDKILLSPWKSRLQYFKKELVHHFEFWYAWRHY